MEVEKVISGGQSGVDRAALDVALELGIRCGGWCPNGRKAEDGFIAARYPMQETRLSDYSERTEWNVRDSDGTLVLNEGELEGGSEETVEVAEQHGKPYLVVDLKALPSTNQVAQWIDAKHIRVLNVAGPRESKRPGIYGRAKKFLATVLAKSRH